MNQYRRVEIDILRYQGVTGIDNLRHVVVEQF